MSDIDYEKMADAIVKAQGSQRGNGIGPAPSSGSGMDSKLVSGLNKATGGLAGEVDKSAKTWQQASNIGIGFNNDAIGLRTSVAQTRLGAEEWGDSIKKGAAGFTSLGGTMTDSAKKFNQMSASFSDTTAADELRKIGFTTKEYNDVLAISLAGKKGQDLATLEGQRKANMAAADLALEMDKVAQLTGVSRREQQEALQEKQKNARVQATIELEIRKGGKDASDAYMNMSTKLKGVGLDKLGDELYTGQALSQKAIAQMNALGPAGNQLREAINATKNARTDEEKAAAKAMMDRAQSAVAERQMSTEYLTMVQRGQGEVAEAAGEGMLAARNYNKGIEEVQAEFKAQGKALTTEQARQVLAERTKKPVDIATGKDKTSAEAAAAKTTETYVLAQARAADGAAKLEKAFNDANKAITANNTATRQGIDKMNAGLANVKPSTLRPGETSTGRERLGLANSEAAGKTLDLGAKGDFKEAGKMAGTAIVEAVRNIKDITTGVINVTGGVLNGNKPTTPASTNRVNRAGGSPNIDNMLEDFGKETPAMLHGKEAVLTKDQLTRLVSKLGIGEGGPGLKTSMPDIQLSEKKVSEDYSKMAANMKMPDMSEFTKKFETASKDIKMPDMSALTKKFETVSKDIKVPEVKMPGAPNVATAQLSAAKRDEDIRKQAVDMQLEAAKAGKDLTREEATRIVAEKVAKEEKAAAEQKIKDAEIKAQTERKAMLESAIKNGPADVAEKARKELLDITKQEKAKEAADKKEAEKKEAVKPTTKGATADIKTDNKNKVSNISKTVPSEIAQQKAEEERKKAAAATATAPKPAATIPASAPALATKTSTLDDLNEQLKQLNKSMGELVSHTSDVSASAEKQVRATKRLDPNVSLRG
jgi:hypothetical protein